jgi:hypothetical protein
MGAIFLFISLFKYLSIYLSILGVLWECSGSNLSIYPWFPHPGEKHAHIDLGERSRVICSIGTLGTPVASRGDHRGDQGGPHV